MGDGRMKPRVTSFFAAEGMAIDQLSSRVTAFNILDHVAVAALPTLLMRIWTFAIYALGDEADAFEERVRLIAPDGKTVGESMTPLVLGARTPTTPAVHRSFHAIWSIGLEIAGDYALTLDRRDGADWQPVSSITIAVVIRPSAFLNAAPPVPASPPDLPPSTKSEQPTR